MKLAEALQLRSELQRKIHELKSRLENNATVQEGEKPSEEPSALLAQLDDALAELERLAGCINLTNARTEKDGKTLTVLLAKRDCLRIGLSVYREFLDEASQLSRRVRGSEIKIRSTVPVAELRKSVDAKAEELRKLELCLQELNWLTELAE